MHRKLLVGSAAFSALAIAGAVVALPAEAGRESATLTVTKTVEGTPPPDAEFVINVYCVSEEENGNGEIIDEELVPVGFAPQGNGEVVYNEDIAFGPDGGSEDFTFFGPALCEITEVEDGGADGVSGEGQVAIEEPILYDAEIVNTFTDATTTTAAPTTTAAAAAGAVAAAPRFTG
jgi:hypothetical protein